jgi:DNA repair protein NreA
MDSLCIRCKGKGLCGKPCKILSRFMDSAPKVKLHFSGKSAPELFVGRVGYPHINSGILAPSENDGISNFATAEEWSANNFSIENVLRLRGQLIYGRGLSHVKSTNQLKQVTQELALSSKPVSTEFFLKKKPILSLTSSSVFRPMTNPAPISRVLLEENVKVEKKIDYLTSDYDIKSMTALKELYGSGVRVDHLQKLLSVGMLGAKIARRMVPTRWSITAVDDTISKQLLKKIRYYPELNEMLLFSGNFVGNYIEVLLLPGRLSFEALEGWLAGNFYAGAKTTIEQDYEGFYDRKSYASNITGGYYAIRLPVCEYLDKIGRQATILVLREIRKEYYAPLGVGIVRECTRRAMRSVPRKVESIDEAFNFIKTRLKISVEDLRNRSWVLENYGKQKGLKDFY